MSFVVLRKDTNECIGEFFNHEIESKVNKEKYYTMPILEYLVRLNPFGKPDIKLSSGRIVKHYRMANGAISAEATPGDIAMTNAEYDEYISLTMPKQNEN